MKPFAGSLLEIVATPLRRSPSMFVDRVGYTNVPTIADMPTIHWLKDFIASIVVSPAAWRWLDMACPPFESESTPNLMTRLTIATANSTKQPIDVDTRAKWYAREQCVETLERLRDVKMDMCHSWMICDLVLCIVQRSQITTRQTSLLRCEEMRV